MSWNFRIRTDHNYNMMSLAANKENKYIDDFAMREVAIGDIVPFMPVERQFLQALMDELWANSFRPAGYHDVHESIKAKEAHLQDLRKIAFKQLEMDVS